MPVHLLLVDDDNDLRVVLKLALEREGFEVVTASNGEEALEALDRVPSPRVMVLDLLMPVMNGWETLDKLREDGRLESIPVVISTSAPDQAPEGYPVISKPIPLDALVNAARQAAR
jgi:two-component system, chemotaxis family, chemotaxis protein CheY